MICGSGVGATIASNKVPRVRASVCHDLYSASQGVEHDDMNLICIGARIVSPSEATKLIKAFLSAVFTQEERHLRRLTKLNKIENKYTK